MGRSEAVRPRRRNWGFVCYKLTLLADPGKRGLTCSEKAVLLAIADHMGQNRVAWPGYGTIAHFAGVDRRTAIRTVQRLARRGVLSVSDGPTDSNHYRIDAHAVAALITAPKHRAKAERLLARLARPPAPTAAGTAAVDERSDDAMAPAWWQDTTNRDGTVPPPDGRTPPECAQERLTRTRSENAPPRGREGDLRSEQGEQGRLSDFVKNHEVSEIIREVEAATAGTLATSTRPVESVATSVVTLFKEVRDEAGRYPSAEEVADALGDPVFRGLRGLSFGLLTAPAKRGEFRRQLVRRVRNGRLVASLLAPNAGDRHDRAVGEAKREAVVRQQEAAAESDPRLPLWLERLHREQPDDPDINAWVAAELAKPATGRTAAGPAPAASVGDSGGRPIGYDWRYDIESSVANLRLEG